MEEARRSTRPGRDADDQQQDANLINNNLINNNQQDEDDALYGRDAASRPTDGCRAQPPQALVTWLYSSQRFFFGLLFVRGNSLRCAGIAPPAYKYCSITTRRPVGERIDEKRNADIILCTAQVPSHPRSNIR